MSSTSWQAAVEKTVTGLGYELVECERASPGLLRAYIDRVPGRSYPSGDGEFVTVEDCELVTRQLQYVLEVEGCDYSRLEVSSPGFERPLRTRDHFAGAVGRTVSVRTAVEVSGRKRFRGEVVEAGDDAATIEVGDERFGVPYNAIVRGNLIEERR